MSVTITVVNSHGRQVPLRFKDDKKGRRFARALTAKGIKVVSFKKV